MGRTREDRIKDLRDRADQLQMRARLLAQQDARKERAQATRRRILLGACVQDLARRGDVSDGQIRSWLDLYLTRASDRAAFGLPSRPSSSPEALAHEQPQG